MNVLESLDTTSKKRKRKHEKEPSSLSKKPRLVENGNAFSPPLVAPLSDLFFDIAQCFATIANLSRNTTDAHELSSVEYMRSVLRISAAQASTLLGAWLCTITQIVRGRVSQELPVMGPHNPESYDLSSILYLWNNRASAAGETWFDDAVRQ